MLRKRAKEERERATGGTKTDALRASKCSSRLVLASILRCVFRPSGAAPEKRWQDITKGERGRANEQEEEDREGEMRAEGIEMNERESERGRERARTSAREQESKRESAREKERERARARENERKRE